MKRENNKKFKKRKRNQNRSLTCRVLSMMFAIVLFCSTVLINTSYVSQASSFDDMVDMVEVEEDSAAADTSENTGDDLDTDVNFESEESPDETYSESDDLGSSDADFSSGENMFTDGTSENSAPTEEAAQPVSCIVNLKNETIEIKAEAPAGVLPNGTQMIVKAVENNTEDAELTDQYNKLAAKITEQLQSQGKNLDGFLAYNVSFIDADGNPVEPSDKVTYSFTYKEASSPELTDPAASTVTAAMIRTNKETSELELTELKAEEDKLTVETNESRQLTKAAFQSAATAAYTFVWSSTPAADDNENNENKEENGEVNNEEVNADTNTENTEENGEEAPDQEQAKMIRVIADEVNLRKAPSTDAEVIAAVSTGTELTLLETVTAENGTIWYKVSYDEIEAYVRSDMAEVVENEEQEIVEEESEEKISEEVQIEDTEGILTFTKTVNDLVEVIATTEVGVIPEDAELIVNPIEQGTDQYAETENKLNEKAGEDGYEIAGFLAYDIYFQDSEGNKIEPVDGSVKVSMHYIEPSVPEEVAQVTENGSEAAVFTEEDEFSQSETTATQMDITMMHLVEDENGNVNVVDMTQEGTANVKTDAAGSVQKAEFETTSFSTFTITWKKNDNFGTNLIIKYVDEEGNEINAENVENVTIGPENTTENKVNLSSYQKVIVGYDYRATKLDSYQGENISYVRIKPLAENTGWTEERVPQVSADGNNWIDVKKSSVIYMVYQKTSSSGTVSDLEVQRQKYIDKNEDGTYDITLNVSGSVETQITKAKVDVLMIADISGSMDEKSRLKNLKIAANALVDTFSEQKDTVDAQYSLVTFSNYGNKVAEWVNSEAFKNEINALTADGGTNYDQGLAVANSCLSSARTQATKIVIFLTDGQPTFYGTHREEVWSNGRIYYYPYGRGDSTSERCVEKALTSASNIRCDKFYGVGIGLPKLIGGNDKNGYIYKYDSDTYGDSGYAASSYYEKQKYLMKSTNYANNGKISGSDILEWVKNKVDAPSAKEAVTISDNNLEELTNKFKNIAYSATTFACSNVTIEDTLSDYVAPTIDANATENNSKLKIKVMKKENDQFTLVGEQDGDITNGVKLAVDGKELEAKYDSNNKKVNLNFPEDYTLKENYYYYVTITNLKPTNKAYEDYQKSGYNAAGDKLTDASEDKNSGVDGGSSSGQPGFYSNTEAKVTYTYNGQEKEVNYSKPVVQVVSSDLIKSKTAKVVDWDQRTYNITLNASSVMESVKAANPVDVVLVVDRSGSMNYKSKLVPAKKCKVTELDKDKVYYYVDDDASICKVWYSKYSSKWVYADDLGFGYGSKFETTGEYQFYIDGDPGQTRATRLKEAATLFTTELKQISPDSRVALVPFSDRVSGVVNESMAESLKDNLDSLINAINNLNMSGGTRQDLGLAKAKNILDNTTSERKKYVILLTDGRPEGDNVTYGMVAEQADNVKSEATLMTVGIGLLDSGPLSEIKNKLKGWASLDSNGKQYSYDADSADQLVGIFKSILKSVTAKAPITNVDVIDYIDSRFELTEQTKKDLTAAGVEYGEDDKGYYVKWSNQTIPEAGANGTAGWSKTIQVKAKDTFIGGNNIPTNGAGSGVIVKGQLLEFEQPHVNVKVKMEVANKTVTIYKGDEMPTNAEILNQLFNMNNKTTSYSESIVDVSKVSVKWYTNQECTTPAKDENGNDVTDLSQLSNADKHPTADKNYYIKVTYDAGVPSAESNQNTTKDGKPYWAGTQQGTSYIESAVNKDNADQKYSIYTVKVISGQIAINKKLADRDGNPLTASDDQKFTFKVTKMVKDESGSYVPDTTFGDVDPKENDKKTGSLEVTVKVEADKSEGTLVDTDVDKLKNLPRGTYEVEEINVPENYRISGTNKDGTDCKHSTETNKVIFKLGYKMDSESIDTDVIVKAKDSNGKLCYTYNPENGGVKGLVAYTNKLVTADLDLKKKDAKTNDPLTGAKVRFEKWTESEGNQSKGAWKVVYDSIEVNNNNKELSGLLPGRYKLTEIEAPTKHAILGSSIYFKVESGKVLLTDENGEVLKNADGTPANNGPSEMWTLDDNGQVLTIKNTEIYSLPSSGGPGIYGFTISGVAFITAALLLFINNKRKEDNIAG
ncbi:DUF7604 domain-containing protein [Lachnospiraceae bacterium SGI.066]